jgi:hypothetical protein
MVAGEVDRRDNVGRSGAARDDGRALVNHRVPHGTSRVVAGITGHDQQAAKSCPQRVKGIGQGHSPRLL